MIQRRHVGWALSVGCSAILSFMLSLSGCEKKPEGLPENECSALRKEAFKLIAGGEGHAGHGCATDADCKETEWPECRRAVSKRYFDEIGALQKKFDDGKCKDTTPACKDSPPVYCKQGLCAIKEPGEKRD